MLEIGEPCLAALRPISENVTYPDNAFVMYEDIYHNHCPCGIGLSCDTKSATCVDPSSHNDFNDLDYYWDYCFIEDFEEIRFVICIHGDMCSPC